MSWLSGLFRPNKQPTQQITSALDLVIYAASLASNTQAIGTTLNKVRAITAQMQTGTNLPAGVQGPLFQAYLEIEQYLMEHEALRSFTKEGLRRRLSESLLTELQAFEAAIRH